MRYFFIDGSYIPKNCIYGPRPREAIFLDEREWYVINENLGRRNRDKEIADMYAAKERNKKEMSFNMTKTWGNTLASVKTQGEERRIEKRERERQEKIDEYNKILENWKEEKKPIVEKARKTLFEAKDEIRVITSGIIQSAVITEREKQIEFRKYLKQEQVKEDCLYAEGIAKDVENYANENKSRNVKNFQLGQKFRNELLEQIGEKKRRIEEREEKEMKAVKEDNVKMMEAIERLKKMERKDKIDRIKRRRFDIENCCDAVRTGKSRAAEEEEEENEINRMINNYSIRFKKERDEREGIRLKEAIEKRAEIAENIHRRIGKEVVDEDEIYGGAAKGEDDERDLMERKEKLKLEIEKSLDEHRKKIEIENSIRREGLKWQIMQNERKKEIYRDWCGEMKKKAREEKMKTANDYLSQINEKREEQKGNIEKDSHFVDNYSHEQHLQILNYSNEALEYARERNFNNYPLLKAIQKIKKENGPQMENRENEAKGEMPRKQPMGTLYYCFKK